MRASERFVELLKARCDGLSQAEVARSLGIDQATMSRYLRGARPSGPVAGRIKRAWPETSDVLTALVFEERSA